jgi:hypothetical protein
MTRALTIGERNGCWCCVYVAHTGKLRCLHPQVQALLGDASIHRARADAVIDGVRSPCGERAGLWADQAAVAERGA